ncbi:hypothetical protein [Aurantimonas sp. HBX-1]|uniref:hypothetical protein n=1 Tax=Aurantimonas sp. HBX-1 TaxID=2906072 RepID=UPI001F374F75|nr:hypothetical protein [Aurantimonas sp. HBX-1]UIJ73478.1 hypothetical protein LXB15_07550 [Aurantimonas sp. HBX-1]
MADDIFELGLYPATSSHQTPAPNHAACERPIFCDPLAWSRDGSDFPTIGLVFAGERRRFPYLMGPPGKNSRCWQAVCAGRNGAEAKENARYLEENGGRDWTWDGSRLRVYDVLWWGWCQYGKPVVSDRAFGVVVEVSDDRLVLWEHDTLAQAVKASLRGQVAAQVNEHALPVRMAAW